MTEPAPVVLVIDDEIQIRRYLRDGLELELDETVPEHSLAARLINVWPV